MRRALCVTVCLAGCAPVSTAPAPVSIRTLEVDPVSGDSASSLPPAGYGSLRQDDFSVQLVQAELHVKVTPLAEEVIRLAAPDTYERLRALAGSRRQQAESATEGAGAVLFLVSFFSRDANVEYRPEELQIAHRGRLQRPAAIMPLTTGWGRQLLQPQQTQSAIYAFDPPFDYQLPLTVRYGLQESDQWTRSVIPRIEDERTRVLSRAGGWSDRPN